VGGTSYVSKKEWQTKDQSVHPRLERGALMSGHEKAFDSSKKGGGGKTEKKSKASQRVLIPCRQNRENRVPPGAKASEKKQTLAAMVAGAAPDLPGENKKIQGAIKTPGHRWEASSACPS